MKNPANLRSQFNEVYTSLVVKGVNPWRSAKLKRAFSQWFELLSVAEMMDEGSFLMREMAKQLGVHKSHIRSLNAVELATLIRSLLPVSDPLLEEMDKAMEDEHG